MALPPTWTGYISNQQEGFTVRSLYEAVEKNLSYRKVNTINYSSGDLHPFFTISGFVDIGYTVTSGYIYGSGTDPSGITWYRIDRI